MKKSLRFLSVVMISLHIFLLLLLLWTATVPMEQIQQIAADDIGEIGNRISFQQNIGQMATLIWSAIGFTAVTGLVIPWMIFRRVLKPIRSIQNTIRQAGRGDPDARIPVLSGEEFEALADGINRLMEYRKQEQEKLSGLNRTLSAICACRHVMIHKADEKRLIQEFCRILVDIGTYRKAWIGFTGENAQGTVTPAALAESQNINPDAAFASREQTACNPIARAIRNRHAAIISDVFADPLFAPLQAEASRNGHASIIALPLSVNQQILGVLALYAEKPDAFGTAEAQLLTELADDLAYSIHTIRFTNPEKTRHQPLS